MQLVKCVVTLSHSPFRAFFVFLCKLLCAKLDFVPYHFTLLVVSHVCYSLLHLYAFSIPIVCAASSMM